MKRLGFYFQHALRDMGRNRRLTLFGLFAVAVGVATVVGLRMLGLMITDTLTSNAQAVNRGDILLTPRNAFVNIDIGVLVGEEGTAGRSFDEETVQQVYDWAEARGIDVTKALGNNLMLASVVRDGRPGAPRIIQSFFIEPELFPFYDTILAEDPEGAPLAELLNSPSDIVIGRNLADVLGAQVGDQIRAGSAEDLFTVRGIVPTTSQGGMRNFFAVLLGFAFFDYDAITLFGTDPSPSELYLRLPDPSQVDDLDHEVRNLIGVSNGSSLTTTEWLEASEVGGEVLNRMVLVLSLGSLLIGGIGIINTMLVLVSRRTLEVAVLKTIGLKGRQITLLFMIEALMLGIVGSVLGAFVGMVLSFYLRGVGELIAARAIVWKFHLDPILIGGALGIAITTVFGFLPTLAAGQVRPAVVLRPTDLPIPRAGRLRSLLALAVLVVVLGAIVGQIMNLGAALSGDLFAAPSRRAAAQAMNDLATGGSPAPFVTNFLVGSALVLGTLLFLGVLVSLLWVLVWLLGHLPSFGNVDLKLAIRALRGHRTRNASTMLALIIGMASLSVIVLITGTVSNILQTQLSAAVGGNVVVMSFNPLAQQGIYNRLDAATGVNGYIRLEFNTGGLDLVAVNGNTDLAALDRPVEREGFRNWSARRDLEQVLGVTIGGNPPLPNLIDGEQLSAASQDQPMIVIPGTQGVLDFGVRPGDQLTYRTRDGATITLTVIGITEAPDDNQLQFSILGRVAYAPIQALPQRGSFASSFFAMTFVDVQEAYVNEVLADMGSILGTLPFDIRLIDSLISRILDQMVALPLLASILSLFAGGVIIANTVALATLERRREIGIMKALGLKGRRVLGLLLLENLIIGLVSGLIGVGLGVIPAIGLSASLTEGLLTLTLPIPSIIGLMVLALLVVAAATLVTAVGAARQKPLTVLRYE
ncbi:MAG: FtsX-like permease family protein [Anaerolineae bacterium]